jgi:hypothetical protein
MATLVDLSGYQYGIETAETSIEVKSFIVVTAPQFKQMQTDKTNSNIGFAVGPIRQEITLEGELNAASLGVLAFTFATACTLGNDKDYFGVSTGDVFLDSATISQTSDGFKSLSMNLSRDPAITA